MNSARLVAVVLDQLAKITQRIPGLCCTVQRISIDSDARANRMAHWFISPRSKILGLVSVDPILMKRFMRNSVNDASCQFGRLIHVVTTSEHAGLLQLEI